MSVAKRQIEERKPRKPKRRYTPDGDKGGDADWSLVNPNDVLELIAIASKTGGALRFGASRDGGAYAIGVYGDGPDVYTVYGGDVEQIATHISKLIDVFESIFAEQ